MADQSDPEHQRKGWSWIGTDAIAADGKGMLSDGKQRKPECGEEEVTGPGERARRGTDLAKV